MCSIKFKDQLLTLVTEPERIYLEECFSQIDLSYKKHFNQIFSTLNRKLTNSRDKRISINSEIDELIIQDWDLIKALRVYLISLVKDESKEYCAFFDTLFEYGDMQELVALYSSLNILDYPKYWIERCQNGIRSNIGLVQEVIIEDNKYPYFHLSETAWNQMVLKSFFTGKNVLKIYGLFERNNQTLAESIVDYIYERDSAKRNIHPILWLLAKDYLPTRAISILEESFGKVNEKIEQSILFYVMLENKRCLIVNDDLDFLSRSCEVIPFSEKVLEMYKNGELCVQN